MSKTGGAKLGSEREALASWIATLSCSVLLAATADAQPVASPPGAETGPALAPAEPAAPALAGPLPEARAPSAEPALAAPETAAPAQVAAVEEPSRSESSWSDIVTLAGYVEAYYSHNFANPENRITNNRWLDERNDSVTLQTVAFDFTAEKGPVSAKVTLMFGPTADRWYFEGARVPEGETNSSLNPGQYSNETWKHLQNAWAAYEAPIGKGLLLLGGLMVTQVGYESSAVKDNWNFSHSNLFNFLPYFHLGARATYPVSAALSMTAAVYNGWNQALDVNRHKSVSLQSSLLKDKWLFNLLYLGGNEREPESPVGKAWRNLFDALARYEALPRLSLAANFDGGFERGDLGTDFWLAGAIYARVKASDWLYFAARGDGIYEQVAHENGESAAIFFGGGDHLWSGTGTVEVRPIEGISLRLEYRHDDSDGSVPLFYKKGQSAAGSQRLASVQNTFTLGLTGWF